MGKIRTKVLGSEEEKEQKKKDKARREGKKSREKKEIKKEESPVKIEEAPQLDQSNELKESPKPKKAEKKSKKSRGQKYLYAKTLVEKTKKYDLDEAIALAKKTSFTNFDGTIEIHINTLEKGIRGTVSLPHGTGKHVRVAIASDELLPEIEAGKINFDILIATPQMMPKLAKVAKILGPKGLMPNPKNGTITTEPEKAREKLSHGQIQFKTENEFPLIHQTIGKVSFDDAKLKDNFKALIEAIGRKKIVSVSLNSTMSPGIKVNLESI